MGQNDKSVMKYILLPNGIFIIYLFIFQYFIYWVEVRALGQWDISTGKGCG